MARLDDPSATGASPSPDGGAAPSASHKQVSHKPFRLSLPSLESVAQTFDLLRKITISFSLIALLVVGLTFLVREVVRDRVIIEPIVVQLDDPKGGLNAEALALEVSRHIAVIQRVGANPSGAYRVAGEPFAVELSDSIITRPINLKQFGAPLNVTTTLAEVANMFGIRHPTIKISIGSRRVPPGYISSVSMVGDTSGRVGCVADNTPGGIDELVECVALSAMSLVDPKAASA